MQVVALGTSWIKHTVQVDKSPTHLWSFSQPLARLGPGTSTDCDTPQSPGLGERSLAGPDAFYCLGVWPESLPATPPNWEREWELC